MSKEIALTQGKVAVVDDDDYEWLSQWKWFAMKTRWTFYAGRSAWVSEKGYRTKVLMSREIMDAPPCMVVLHTDFDGLNNQRSNLRLCSRAENNRHQRKHGRCTSSHFKGVYWDISLERWRARIRVNGSCHNLGRFDDEVDAARVYNAAALALHGEFAHLNALPGCPGSG